MIASHSTKLLEAFEPEAERGAVGQWLEDEGRRSLSRKDADALALWCGRPEGWEEQLQVEPDKRQTGSSASVASPKPSVRDREKIEKARAERDEARKESAAARTRTTQLERELAQANAELEAIRSKLAGAETQERRAVSAAVKEANRVKRALDKALLEKDQEKRRARAEIADLKKQLTTAKAAGEKSTKKRKKTTAKKSDPAGRRSRLKAPLGRLETDPATLKEWLSAEEVHLLVDGYNVTKAEGGFGDLELEQQRDRLIDIAERLGLTTRVPITIVFDGSDVVPARKRRRGGVKVEYSVPPMIADDHLVEHLERMPAVPVVVVTNDRELQHRVKRLGATVATSDQFLSVAR